MKFPTQSNSGAVILANFALTMLKALLVLAFLGLMLMSVDSNKKYDTEGFMPPVFAMLVLTWPNESDSDIDIHVRCSNGDQLNYKRKEACFANLERDARGVASDWSMINNERVVVVNNREVVAFRTPVPGEWIVNVHYYNGRTQAPVNVKLEIILLHPKVHTAFERVVTLQKPAQEAHMVRFEITSDKLIYGFDTTRDVKLVTQSLNTAPGTPPAPPR